MKTRLRHETGDMTRSPARTGVRLDDPTLETLLDEPVVVLMVGPAGGEKSTVARELATRRPHLEIVSYDREQADGRIVGAAAVARAHARLGRCCADGRGALSSSGYGPRVVPGSAVRAHHDAVTELLPRLPAEGYDLVAVLAPAARCLPEFRECTAAPCDPLTG